MTTIDESIAFEADREWIEDHIAQLAEHYADHWIAVKGGHIIASDVNLGELLSKVPDLAYTCIEFIDRKHTIDTL